MRRWLAGAALALSILAGGCGYSWQGNANPWAAKGVKTIYVRSLRNDTLHSGAEVSFTSALVKVLSRGTKIQLVADEKLADGVIEGTVDTILNAPSGPGTTVGQLTKNPSQIGTLADVPIAGDYIATASITVTLLRNSDHSTLWHQGFTQSKIYPGNNRYGASGNTSALINASQQQFAINEIAQFIARDVYDAMFEAF